MRKGTGQMEDKEQRVPTWFYAAIAVCYAGFLGFYIYDRLRDTPELKFDMPFDPNREIRQEYERRAMEKQMTEWDESGF